MSRSYLFIPGNTPAMLQNLDVFDSDAIIIDFEDSVLQYDKDAARILVSEFLKKFKFTNTEVYIRINDTESNYFKDDVTLMNDLNIAGYVLPKATPQSVELLRSMTTHLIIPIIESPIAVLQMEEIAKQNQIKGLLLGAEDLTKELNINRTLEGTEILYTRSKMALVCNAYKIESIDTPYTNKDDETGIYTDSRNARNLGFTSKSSIHPNHVDAINETFSPSSEDITQSLRILKKAEANTKGAFSLDGKMVDAPIIEKAKKVIEEAKKYNLL